MIHKLSKAEARLVAGRYLAAHPGRLAAIAEAAPQATRAAKPQHSRHHRRSILAGLPAAAVLKLAQNVIIWKGLSL